MLTRRSVAVGAITLLAACAQPAAAPVDLAAEERAVRDASMAWLTAAKARNVDGEAAVMGSDVVFYRAHQAPISGLDAVKAYTTGDYAKNPKIQIDWTTTEVIVSASGDIAVEMGKFMASNAGPKGDGADTGSFVTVWRKTNGAWKVARDIGSTMMPEPPAKK